MPKKPSRKKLTRQELRDLDIEIGFLEGVTKRDPKYIDALQILGDDYTKRGRFTEGLKVDERLSSLRPSDPLVFYNLACSYSLLGFLDQGVAALERSLMLGYRDFKWLLEDPDLENLRKSPFYTRVRAKVRSLRVKISE
jgi:tetratricopeptide (TPR) repeat protein